MKAIEEIERELELARTAYEQKQTLKGHRLCDRLTKELASARLSERLWADSHRWSTC